MPLTQMVYSYATLTAIWLGTFEKDKERVQLFSQTPGFFWEVMRFSQASHF